MADSLHKSADRQHHLATSVSSTPPRVGATHAPLLTTAEVAAWLGVSARTICLWAELDEIPAFKLGHQWRFREATLQKWIEDWQHRPNLTHSQPSKPTRTR